MERQAWIQDPETAKTSPFHWHPKSWSGNLLDFVDTGRPLTGALSLLKSLNELAADQGNQLLPCSTETAPRSDLDPEAPSVGQLSTSGECLVANVCIERSVAG